MAEQQPPTPNEFNCPPDWRARRTPWLQLFYKKISDWAVDQKILMEAFWVAVTFHVLLFPLIWLMGWTLPWPKPPQITTVIEINLEHWPEDARPERIQEIYNYKWSQAHKAP